MTGFDANPVISSRIEAVQLMVKSKKTTENRNKLFKNRVYRLCGKVEKGDRKAEAELQELLTKSTTAVWAVKHWLKRSSSTSGARLAALSKIRRARDRGYGSAFKSYQGGSPGLGRHS